MNIKPDFVAGIIGNVITILLCTSPAGAFWGMAKKKSAGEYNAFPCMNTFIGVLCALVTIAMYASPLSVMIIVIRSKTVECMSFLLSFFLLLNAGAWFAFAMFLQDPYLIVPNMVGLASGSAQLIIYIMYKKKPSQVMNTSVEMIEEGCSNN
ncbi:hypothetical protein KY284_002741 [Solanum tuberosum]|nr:hypothetical protein KY284_002741 [Solanum tuberosum]